MDSFQIISNSRGAILRLSLISYFQVVTCTNVQLNLCVFEIHISLIVYSFSLSVLFYSPFMCYIIIILQI